uniref:Dehydrogenase/reductase (SDR family) member 13b.1 n=1 Tax=Astyanax mexicanus TaxID=7994 RepID=A0A8B9HMC6_ASTMX
MSVFFLGVGIVVVAYFLLRIYVSGARCKSKAKLDGKTVIVTGSNTGIGRETAVDLARRGARVILACRSQIIIFKYKNTQNSEIASQNIDLASQDNSHFFYLFKGFLIHQNFFKKKKDGLGLMFEVNHLGHFLLTHLLLDRLKECGPSRVVNVSSMLHQHGNLDFNVFNTHKEFGAGDSLMDVMKVYSHSKLCNVLFTHELAKRLQGTNVTCYSLHPGVINTELTRHYSKVLKMVLKPIIRLFSKDLEAGAQTTLYCAVQEGIEGLSGRYFSDCAVKEVQPKARDNAVAKKLWELSEKLCDLS